MAMYAATATLFKVGNGASPEVYVTVSQILDIGGTSESATAIDTMTHNAAVTSRNKTYIAGLVEPGTTVIKLGFDGTDATQNETTTRGLIALKDSGSVVNMKIQYPALVSPNKAKTFQGFVQTVAEGHPLDGLNTLDVTIKISGAITHGSNTWAA